MDEKIFQLSTEVADIVNQIDKLILSLDDEHIEVIVQTIESIRRDQSRYNAIGIMFEPETSGPRRKLAKQSTDRLRAILLWRECVAIMNEAQVEALVERAGMRDFKRQLGL